MYTIQGKTQIITPSRKRNIFINWFDIDKQLVKESLLNDINANVRYEDGQ